MALTSELLNAGHTAEQFEVTAAVSLEPDGACVTITRSALMHSAQVPGIAGDEFQRFAHAAETGCPVCKLMKRPR